MCDPRTVSGGNELTVRLRSPEKVDVMAGGLRRSTGTALRRFLEMMESATTR
jgi:hypothetical protein